MIPKSIKFELKSDVSNSFRATKAAQSLDIDVRSKSTHKLNIENINIPNDWNIGLIYGASGSGKTTLAKHLFGDAIFDFKIDEEKSIIDLMPESMSYEDCQTLLNGIGLSSVPCWIRPIKTLSNGQKARCEAVLLMLNDGIVLIDEWTSVVDRTVAKAMSICISKYAKKHNKKLILLSCHYDILEWLQPNWLIDCNKQEFCLPQSEDFFFTEREKLTFEIRETTKETWKYFSKYHYLGENLPGGKVYFYGIFHNENQIGFKCFANYTPHKKGTKIIYHANRLIIHPDYQGLQLGLKFSEITNDMFFEKMGKNNIRILAKFSAIPMFKALIKSKKWKFLKEQQVMGKLPTGGNMDRQTGFREYGIKTFHFEYYGTR